MVLFLGGMLNFFFFCMPDFFFRRREVNGRCYGQAYVAKKNESTLLGTGDGQLTF